MNAMDLLGKVAAQYLRNRLTEHDSMGIARFQLDCLTSEQTAAVARAIQSDVNLFAEVEIKLPRDFLINSGLPQEMLTTQRTTYFRNASCEKPALLVANVGDDEEQSLKELLPIGAPQLLSHPELWVEAASETLRLTQDHKKWWERALQGLVEARAISLECYSQYVATTRIAILQEGHPIRNALGNALPALRLPRDTNYFNALNDKTAGYRSKWKKLFFDAFKKRACYLVKKTSTQALLDKETLDEAFEKVRDSIPVNCHPVIRRFIEAPGGWNGQAAELAMCEWEWIKPLFDGLRRERFNLGSATLEFFDELDPELLTDDEHDYLERLIKRRTTEADDEDEAFYESHRLELKGKPSLKARWDRFVYGTPVETEDFLSGMVQCFQALFDQDQQGGERKLTIRSDKRTPNELKNLNRDAGLFFSFRYRGLTKLLGRRVTWDVGKLFEFSDLDRRWREARRPSNRSIAKAALQIKFYLDLDVKLSTGNIESYTKQLVWHFNPNAISSELHDDWSRLVSRPLVLCHINREMVSGKGRFQSVDLKDVRTLQATYDKDRGSLVAVYRAENDITVFWPDRLKEAVDERRVEQDVGSRLSSLFGHFAQSYGNAIRGFWESGFANTAVLTEQLNAYSNLLIAICRMAKGDLNRETLLKPLLQLGAAPVEGGPTVTITAPWHPLRLAAMANKALQVAGLMHHLISSKSIFFGDTKLYFQELKAEFDHPYYPELIVGWRERKPELLALTDHQLDYSLHESPIVHRDSYTDTNENPRDSALRVIEIIKRYLALHPHEQANLSVVLYNCDSARLPQAIVDRLQEIQEDEEDLRCQVVLRHRNGAKLRDLYERIIESLDADADSFVASEATRDFMARLRIGIMADEAPPPEEADGPPTDVVFLQDVIARHSRLEWYLESAQPVDEGEWIPPRWSRRRPAASDDMKSVVYLTCPVASTDGWNYLTAITAFFRGDWDGEEGRRLLPARQLNFNDPETAQIFREVHHLGNWVVNYDELLDRRQLVNQGVKVIRYKQTENQGRNMLISSNCSTTLLHRMVQQRLRNLTLELNEEDLDGLAKRFIEDANLVSGDLVLRAAKRGRNASELMGVVLSRYLIQRELGQGRYFGWFFLDDYADWLGQKEEHIADIMALSPEIDELGNMRLAVIISEAKYIDYSALSPKTKESRKQLRQTIDRIAKALFGDPGRLDRDIWLSRFSDLVLAGINFPANAQLDLSKWRRSIRDGNCGIYLRGYSHVFVSGPTDCPECSDFAHVEECENTFQEIFSRAELRKLILGYRNEVDPFDLLRAIATEDVWTNPVYKRPSERITTLVKLAKTTPSKPDNEKSPEVLIPSNLGDASTLTGVDEVLPPTAVTETTGGFNPSIQNVLRGSKVAEIGNTDEEKTWLKEIENQTKGALQQFQLQSKLVSSTVTPNAALLKFQGSPNLTVEQVSRRRSEFLTTHGLTLISVRAEPGLVCLSLARPSRRILTLPEAWNRWNPETTNGNQELLIGVKEDDGNLLLYSPRRHAPHALIAGSTGSGKSVLMQNIILSIVSTNAPDRAKILLIDPKLGVDYFAFECLPHLEQGLITERRHATTVLNELVGEMDRRYQLLRDNRVNNVFDLLTKPDATEKPPILWVIHDEFAEWMLTSEYSEAIQSVVSRLGVKARAAGIFLIFAAQRPDATVMPMHLRANLGNRLVLRVDSEGTSEIALGVKGAERLLGKGHLAAKLEGEPDIIYAQVPFVDSDLLDAIVSAVTSPELTTRSISPQ